MSSDEVNFYSLSAPRLAEERKRLRLNQLQAAQSCGVSREMWGRYERGVAVPGGEVLFNFAAAGADIQYIVTGKHPERLPAPPLNAEVLEAVIEWLEERLSRSRKMLPPEKKAQAILLAYQLVAQDGQINQEKLAPVLKLVA